MTARNYDLFMPLFVPVVIGRRNCFGFGFWAALFTCYWIYETELRRVAEDHAFVECLLDQLLDKGYSWIGRA